MAESTNIKQRKDVRSKEERTVMVVYACITGRIASSQLFDAILPPTVVRIMELAFICGMIWFTFKVVISGKYHKYVGWPLALIVLLAICNSLIIIRGNYAGGIKDILLDKFAIDGIPVYILPFVILLLPNRRYFLSILEVLFYSVLLMLPIWLINSGDLLQEAFYGESVGAYLPFFCPLLFLFWRKIDIRKIVLLLVIYLFYFILMLLNARRNMIVSLSLFFIVALLASNSTLLRRNMRAIILVISAIILSITIVVASWGTLSTTLFDRVLYRGIENTRSQVELLFIYDLASSPASDWIIGRGIDGAYEQISQNMETMETQSERDVIETGYLYLILKGGIVYLLLIMIFLFTAFFKGISCHKPLFTGLSLFLLIYLLDLYMTNPVSFFSVKTVIFWFIVSLCLQYSGSTAPKFKKLDR